VKWGSDASSIFEGDQLFFDIPVHKDDVYESLFEDCDPELDTLTQMALELLSHSILLILDRQAKDQLHTGKYVVSKHTVEAAGFIFNNRSRDPKSRSDTVLVFGTDFVCSISSGEGSAYLPVCS
jgi:hypothetical protein